MSETGPHDVIYPQMRGKLMNFVLVCLHLLYRRGVIYETCVGRVEKTLQNISGNQLRYKQWQPVKFMRFRDLSCYEILFTFYCHQLERKILNLFKKVVEPKA